MTAHSEMADGGGAKKDESFVSTSSEECSSHHSCTVGACNAHQSSYDTLLAQNQLRQSSLSVPQLNCSRRFSFSDAEELRIRDLLIKFPNLVCRPPTPQLRAISTIMRNKNTAKEEFVFYADRLIRVLIEDALNELPFTRVQVNTPVNGATFEGVKFATRICGVSVVRAGESMESALRAVCRGCRIGKILIQRDEDTKRPQLIYHKLPLDIKSRWVLLMDPMLATGGSAIRAVDVLLEHGVPENKILFVNLVASPEGLHKFFARFKNIKMVSQFIDEGINDDGYIVPGFGDFGDRYFGTCP